MNEILQEAMGEHVLLTSKPKLSDADKLAWVREKCFRIINSKESESTQLGLGGAFARGQTLSCKNILAIIDGEGEK